MSVRPADSDVERAGLLSEDQPNGLETRMSFMGRGLYEGNFPPECECPDPIINVIMYFKKAPTLACLQQAFQTHMLSLTRFKCRAENGLWIPLDGPLDLAYHFQEVAVPDDRFIDGQAEDVAPRSLDPNRPLWQVIVYRAPPAYRSAVLLRVHHCIGDGLGLLFAFAPIFGCPGGESVLSKLPLPSQFLPPAARAQKEAEKAPSNGCVRSICGAVTGAFVAAWRFLRGAAVPLTATYDDEVSLNLPLAERKGQMTYSGRRRFVRLPPADLERLKRIGKQCDASVNDVLLALLSGALRRYGAQVLHDKRLHDLADPKEALLANRLQFKALMTVALPRPVDENDRNSGLRNRFNFASMPLPLGVSSPAERLKAVKAAMAPLKSIALIMGSWLAAQAVIKLLPRRFNQKTVVEFFSKHSLVCANVPGPSVPTRWPAQGGEVFEEVHLIFPNLISQVSMLSYNGKVFTSLTVDPELWREADAVGRTWLQELDALEAAVCQA